MKLNSPLGRFLERLADRFARSRFDITREWSKIPYLTRWALHGDTHTDGRRVFLHRFQRSDADEMHDHPWPFKSLVLAGGYWEITPAAGWRNGNGPTKRRWYGPGSILNRPARWIHRVEIPDGCESWTLVMPGLKVRSWGFWCPNVGFLPWRQHMANAEANATHQGCG